MHTLEKAKADLADAADLFGMAREEGDDDTIEAAITDDAVDLLLISPERLANEGFRDRVFQLLLERTMALVCDEAHCISDWGHDFRPDYLRLRHLLDELPS